MKLYVRLNQENYVMDALTYPYATYKEIEVATIPEGLLSGSYQLVDGLLIEDVSKRPEGVNLKIKDVKEQMDQEVETMKAQLTEQSEALIELSNMLAEVVVNG